MRKCYKNESEFETARGEQVRGSAEEAELKGIRIGKKKGIKYNTGFDSDDE